MLKRMSLKKIIISSAILFTLLLLYIIPSSNELNIVNKTKQVLEYQEKNTMQEIYLIDKSNYVARTKVIVYEKDTIELAKEIFEILKIEGKYTSRIPNGFKPIIPADTTIINIEKNNNTLKINLSKEFLDVEKEYEEKLIEVVTYSLTSINDINNIIIFIDGKILNQLPKTKINLPSTLSKKIGVNKEYDIKSTNNIQNVTIYYVNKYNDSTYYVPVTKYLNDDREKIKIIIEELSSSPISNTNLMSYLNSNTKLLETNQTIDKLDLNFNSYIFSSYDEQNILEEVIYTIGLSVRENYDVKEVNIYVDNKEIIKSVLNEIE